MRSMRSARVWLLLLGLVSLPAAALAASDEPSPSPPPPLIETLGVTVTEDQALERIAFRPFVPAPLTTEIALIPPFHNGPKEDPRSYGIAYEYVQRGRHYVLREWPQAAGGSLSQFSALGGESQCKDAHLIRGSVKDVQGVGWETGRIIFALQPDDGLVQLRDRGAALRAEWHRLVERGACR